MGAIQTGKFLIFLSLAVGGFCLSCTFAGTVRLAWDAGPDQMVAGYHVYRSTQPGEGFSRVNPLLVRTPGYTDTRAVSGTTYYYAVTAVSKSGLESDLSEEVVAHVPPNRSPTARDDAWATFLDTPVRIPVLDNDEDPDGDRLAIVGIVGAGHGRISLNSDRTIRYNPAKSFIGTDSFQYLIHDGESTSNWAVVSVTIRLPGDVNGDGRVEWSDLSVIASSLRSPADGPADPRDLDQDGTITLLDFQEAYSRCEDCPE